MTIPSTTRRAGPFFGNDLTLSFPFTFKIFDEADVAVVAVDANGTETNLVLNADYTVTLNVDQSVNPGGSVTYPSIGAPMTSGTSIVIIGNLDYNQTLALPGGGSFNPTALERQLDRATMQIQQLREILARAATVPVTDTDGVTLPTAAQRASKYLVFDGAGNPGVSVGTGTDTGLRIDLATSGGSALSGFLQSGVGATTRTVQGKLRESVSVTDFGASPSASAADNVTAINAAVTYAKTLDSVELLIPAGRFSVNAALVFDLPNYSTLRFVGSIVSSVSAAVAVSVGANAANTFGLNVIGLKVERTATDSVGSSTGIELRSLVASAVDIRKCTGFHVGILCNGVSANGGFSYNSVHMGLVHDNRTNLRLAATGDGYCNENSFFGGSFNHSSNYPAVATANIDVTHFAASVLNNNRFFGPSLEDHSELAVAATINGNNNVLFWPRMERTASQATYKIEFTATSAECAVIGNSFSLVDSNIDDAGTNTKYETRDGIHVSHQVTDDVGKAVYSLQSTASSNARLLRFLDSAGVVTGWVKGSGAAELKNLSLTNLGNYADDATAAAAGVGVNGLYRNGSVLMVRVG